MASSCPYKAVGRRIREARFLIGNKTQAKFGEEIGGFSAGQIGQVERGRNLPTGELLTALAKRGINVNWILTGEGPMWHATLVRLSEPVQADELPGVLETLQKIGQKLEGFRGATIPDPELQAKIEARRRMAATQKAELAGREKRNKP